MNLNVLTRRLHYWGSALIALPVIVMIGSGLLLQLKKHWDWVQPPEREGAGAQPAISLAQILESVKGVPELGVSGWKDVNRVDLRPSRGMAKVWLYSGWEAQICLLTGRVLHVAYRRSDIIESIHDGSFFAGNWTRLGLFLPAGLVLLSLWLTGLWMLWTPIAARRLNRRADSEPRRPRSTRDGRYLLLD